MLRHGWKADSFNTVGRFFSSIQRHTIVWITGLAGIKLSLVLCFVYLFTLSLPRVSLDEALILINCFYTFFINKFGGFCISSEILWCWWSIPKFPKPIKSFYTDTRRLVLKKIVFLRGRVRWIWVWLTRMIWYVCRLWDMVFSWRFER